MTTYRHSSARHLLGFALVFCLVSGGAWAQSDGGSSGRPSAHDLLQAAEDAIFPKSFEADVTLTTTENGSQTSQMQLALTYRHNTGSYMEVEAPARSRGLRFLQIADTLWMYNPRAGGGRAIRLSPRSSFQGSAFSNRDLSDPEFANDYTVELSGRESVDRSDGSSVDCWVVDATAKNDQIAYARIRMWISVEGRLPVRSDYYAKSGLLFKRADYRDVKQLAGATRPTVIEMHSEQQSDLVSTMEITSLQEATDLPDRIFTERYLTR